MFTLPKAIYIFNGISHQNSNGIVYENRKNNPKICMEPQKTSNSKAILEKKNKLGDITLLHFLISNYITNLQ